MSVYNNNRIYKIFNGYLPETESFIEAEKQKYAYSCGLPVPKIFSVTKIDGKQAIIMEFIKGRTLGDLLLKNMKQAEYYLNKKPFTMNGIESEELLSLSKQYNAKIVIDFEWRYLPVRQKVKDLIRNNEIGNLLHVEYHISNAQYQLLQSTNRGWLDEKEKFGGMLGALGTHMIDCVRWLSQDEMHLINGFVHTHVPMGAGVKRDADDAFFIHGKMKNDSTFSIQLLSGIHQGFGSHLKVFGDSGTISLRNDKQLYYGKINEQLCEILVPLKGEIPQHFSLETRAYYTSFYPLLKKAYEYFTYHKLDADLPTIEDGHENQLIIDKIKLD